MNFQTLLCVSEHNVTHMSKYRIKIYPIQHILPLPLNSLYDITLLSTNLHITPNNIVVQYVNIFKIWVWCWLVQ